MDNKQEQNTEFDKLLGSAQDDAKIDFGDSEADNLDDFMQEEDEPKEFSPFASVADDSFIPDEVPEGGALFGPSDADDKNGSEQDALPSFLTQQNEETEHTFAPDDEVMEFLPAIEQKSDEEDFSEEIETVDPIKDFSDFKLNDLDSALKSFQEARRGKSDKNKNEPEDADIVYDTSMPEEILANAEDMKEEEKPAVKYRSNMNPQTVDDKDVKLYGLSEESMDMLRWYSGSIGDKTYELSRNNMPEFLDTDKTIRVIHVNVASPYGWNVFFDNGIFMNLQDLQSYQRRHGKMPYNSGKIVYGNKSTQFENINRIVAYELPRYFSYKPE